MSGTNQYVPAGPYVAGSVYHFIKETANRAPIDSIKLPTNEDGRIIPVLFGTKRLKAPQLLWYGDLSLQKVYVTYGSETTRTNMTTGFRMPQYNLYKLGMHLGYCVGPIDKITKIEMNDLEVWGGTHAGGVLTIEKLIPVQNSEVEAVGIIGDINVVAGHKATAYDSYLFNQFPGAGTTNFPNFSGLFSIIVRAPAICTSKDIPPWVVTAQRILYKTDGSAQWYPEKAVIDDTDMNPAHIIRECFSDKLFGMGYPDAYIDDVTLAETADTLYDSDENFGMSMLIDDECSVQDIINEVERAVDGYVFFDRTVGKLTFKLRRKDYSIPALPVINDDGIVSIDSIEKTTQDEMPNAIKINYWNKATDKDETLTIRDTALSILKNGTIITELSVKGVTTPENAMVVATRYYSRLAFPAIITRFTADSQYATMNKGAVFKLTSSDHGLNELVCRVESINIGSYGDRQVVIEAIEENVDLGETIIDPPDATEWVPVSNPPENSPFRLLQDAPYLILRMLATENDLAQIPPTYGVVIYTGSAPTNDTINLAMKIDSVELSNRAFTAAYGTLAAGIGKTDLTVELDMDSDDIVEGAYFQIDDEIIYISEYDSTGITVLRGCADTVPAAHLANADVVSLMMVASDLLKKSGTVTGLIAPQTLQGLLDWDDATEDSTTIESDAGRHYRPIVPGNVLFEGQYWPSTIEGDTVNVTWGHRDRANVEGDVIHFYSTGVTSEEGVTYNIYLYAADSSGNPGELIDSETDITGNSHSFTPEDPGDYVIILTAERDNVTSWQSQSHEFTFDNTPGNYNSGSFTATVTGFSAATTTTIKWARLGDIVVVQIPQCLGTSNSDELVFTGFPEEILPNVDVLTDAACPNGSAFFDNGSFLDDTPMIANLYGYGGLAIGLSRTEVTTVEGWTASGQKGVYYPIIICYNIGGFDGSS